jgi:hypothetical protein
MSKSVKTIVSVAAMIAIPYFAPIIANSAALAGVVGTIGTTATSALVGAGLGAAKGAILGEDIGRSALMGGIGGGISGYNYAPSVTSAVPQSAITAANASADPIAALNASQGFTGVDQAYLASITAADPIAVMNAQQGFTTADPTYLQQAAQTPASAGLDTSGLAGAMPVPTAQLPVQSAAAPATTPTAASAAPKTFMEALKAVPSEIAAKFSDPKSLADLTLRAAGMLAGSALAGSGLSNEEQTLLNQQTEELRTLQQENAGLFRQRLEQAQNLIGESKYFDPEYFGLQRSRRAQMTGAQAKRAGLRGLTGAARESESRRFDLATGRDTGTAFDQGYSTGVTGRLQTMQAGLTAMPTAYPSNMGDYTNLRSAYDNAATRQRRTQQDIGDLFGSITGGSKATSRG